MAADAVVKQGDTKPSIEAILKNPAGVAQNITGATVKFNMKNKAGVLVIDHGTVTIVDGPTGSVRYDWQAGDTDVAGDYQFEFEVDFGGGQIETYPNTGNKKLKITPQIA